ncbi:catechol-2,3-dioxygenase [Paenibacillus eucommiae]|uniref:Catechol-2,3-dioxygenase n=1 Tax=Paenibacillus eucommiae TaxID=1355755 RepID=A0ABS4IWH2_9BACL|nr:catechol-2,3-dioxygenase [Paenibacillus eucommiae]
MKITEVLLGTHRFEAMKTFYGSLLGLEILEDQPSQLSFQAGESVLAFRENSPTDNAFYHVAFTIPTNKFAEAKQWVIQLGIPLFSKTGQDEFPFESWNATALYFYDPDDNLIEFIAHHTLDNAASEAFGPKHLLRISEIGLPVDDVPDAAKKLADAFQLSLWGGDGKQFAPLGDVEGVLIVVDKQRPWFPDDRVPDIFNTRVSIKGTETGSASLSLQNGLYDLKST